MERTLEDQLLDSVPDGVFTVDADWRILSFNRAAERITGVPRREALGRRCCEVFRTSICENACALKQTLATHRPVTNKVVYIVSAQGERIPISISTAELRDADGRIIGGVESFRDLRLVAELRQQARDQDSFFDIIGRSAAMRRLFELLPVVADSDSTVLFEGPSGTGKEVFARALHRLSARKEQPFVAVNCGALPDTLLESELFGYKAGAFTDARKDKPGRFALAEGGTLFLDEIADISPAMQTRFLRVLQERVYEPLGSVRSVRCDVRIVAASNRPLNALVREGRFREDLFYRINVVRLELPPLRERREDIPLLIDHFVARFNRLRGRDIAGLSDAALAALMQHDFPGNVRELESTIEHAFVLCRSGLIEPAHLPPHFQGGPAGDRAGLPGSMTLEQMETWFIGEALRRHQGNRAAAARDLGIATSTLFRKLKRRPPEGRRTRL
ncbi:MAG: sigma 54-interacting transcriptional regulator [Verrucomicrobiales bacterium]|nr:sigma 54-interacting transcriptional regulator [Verrucomicrobiales bacterium]